MCLFTLVSWDRLAPDASGDVYMFQPCLDNTLAALCMPRVVKSGGDKLRMRTVKALRPGHRPVPQRELDSARIRGWLIATGSHVSRLIPRSVPINRAKKDKMENVSEDTIRVKGFRRSHTQ